MADNDSAGQVDIILTICQSDTWRELWDSLGLEVQTFEQIGLSRAASDLEIWQECQRREIILVTANRTSRGANSLEMAIRSGNIPVSLPVFTLANAQRINNEGHYAQRVAVQLLQYLMEIDSVRGTGRLYLP